MKITHLFSVSFAAQVCSAEHYSFVEEGAKSILDVAVSTRAISSFGTTLFAEVCADKKSENVLVSPISMYQLLALIDLGSTPGSQTDMELNELLGSEADREKVSRLEDEDVDGVVFDMATSVWANELKESFIEQAQESQDAESFPLPSEYAPINEWVEEHTNGLIPELFKEESVDDDVEAILVQTVYFKGIWTVQFDPKVTKLDRPFTKSDGTEVPANYMYARRKMEIIENSDALGGASAVILDYGTDESSGEFASMFILPGGAGRHKDMASIISGLATQPLTDLLKESQKKISRVELPRFKLDFGLDEAYNMIPVLMKMGMEAPFGTMVEQFKEMSRLDLYISDVIHGATMIVNEEGSEAAAASAAELRSRKRDMSPYLSFDHPFAVVLFHRPTGTPLFMGKLEDPDFI